MNNIQSNSQESLTTKIRELTNNSTTTKEIVDSVVSKCRENNLDFDKVSSEIVDSLNRANGIRSVSAYVRGILSKILTNKISFIALKKEAHVVSCVDFVYSYRVKGIHISNDDCMYLSIMWEHLLNAGITQDEAIELNKKILIYMTRGQTFEDYVKLVKKSRLVSPILHKIDWDLIEKESKEHNDRWNKIMAELEKISEKDGESYFTGDELMEFYRKLEQGEDI